MVFKNNFLQLHSVVLHVHLLNYEHMSDYSMWNCVELRECRKCPEKVIIHIHGYTCTYIYYIDDLWRHNANALMTSQYMTYVWIQCKLSWMREYAGKWFLTSLELIYASMAKRRKHVMLHFWRDTYLGVRISSLSAVFPARCPPVNIPVCRPEIAVYDA